MGAKDNRPTGAESGNEPKQTANSSTGSSGNRGTGGRTGRTAAGATEKEKSPKLVMVDLPGTDEEKAAQKKAAAAERKRKSRANQKAASSKKTVVVASNTQMKVMLMTLSGILASRPGMEVWALSPEEADQIVTPLSGIMAKSNIGESVGEYADHIALAIACFTIFIPKFLMWQATKPKKEEVKYVKQHQTTGSGSTNTAGTTTTSSGPSNRPSTDDLSNVNETIANLIPASVGI